MNSDGMKRCFETHAPGVIYRYTLNVIVRAAASRDKSPFRYERFVGNLVRHCCWETEEKKTVGIKK